MPCGRTTPYDLARESIEDGDLIAIRSRRGLLAHLTRWITRSPYTHTAVAIWVGPAGARRLLVGQINGGGNALVPLSQYAHYDFDVFDCPVDRVAASAAVWIKLGERLRYDVGDLLRVAANRLLGVPLPARDRDGMICSAMSGSIYLISGWHRPDLPSIPAPDDLVRAVGGVPRLRVRA